MRSKQPTLIAIVAMLTLTSAACTRAALEQGEGAGSSGLSDVQLNLPAGYGTDYTGVRLTLTRGTASLTDTKCSADSVDTSPVTTASASATISKKLQSKCSYLLVLDLGTYDATTKALTAVGFSNKTDTSAGTLIPIETMQPGRVPISITVYKVAAQPLQPNPVVPNPILEPNPNPTPIDPNQAVGYESVKNILKDKCSECHSGRVGMLNVSTFPFVSSTMTDQKKIVQRIIDTTSGAAPTMPPGPRSKFTADEVQKFRDWLTKL